jgi:hypothetical protein
MGRASHRLDLVTRREQAARAGPIILRGPRISVKVEIAVV